MSAEQVPALKLPLNGVRVLDLTHRLAGPTMTMLLGDWGADVLKLEHWQRMDAWRGMISVEHDVNDQQLYNKRPNWLKLNRDKRSVTVNLKTEEGKAIFLDLVKQSDVVADNFSALVMERLGLGYGRLSAVNPGIVMISMPGFGNTGPHARFVSNGATIEGYAGLASLTGYDGGPPRNSVGIWPDPVAGMHGAVAVAMALIQRQKSGTGQYIELSQAEAMINMIGDAVLDYAVNGTVRTPAGNSDLQMAPHGVYPCVGDDRWITIAVGSNDEWRALCKVSGAVLAADDPRFATVEDRRRNFEDLDCLMTAWTSSKDAGKLTKALQDAGVAAAPVTTRDDFEADPDLPSKGFQQKFDYEYLDTYPGTGGRLNGEMPPVRLNPPKLGQHTFEILGDLLGLTGERLQQLRNESII